MPARERDGKRAAMVRTTRPHRNKWEHMQLMIRLQARWIPGGRRSSAAANFREAWPTASRFQRLLRRRGISRLALHHRWRGPGVGADVPAFHAEVIGDFACGGDFKAGPGL